MNWQIEWGSEEVVFGYEFAEILAEGIEAGIEQIDYERTVGDYCEGCGEFGVLSKFHAVEECPTDRGTERRLMAYKLCAKCLREFESI